MSNCALPLVPGASCGRDHTVYKAYSSQFNMETDTVGEVSLEYTGSKQPYALVESRGRDRQLGSGSWVEAGAEKEGGKKLG